MKIGDREYPMRLTLGAMLRFRRETGKELNEAEVSLSMTMLTVLMWCCLLQPWSRKTLRPTDVLRLPWDKKEDVRKTSGAQSTRSRFEEMRQRAGM